MSRIFDALRQAGVDRTGVDYPDMVSVAAKVFESPDLQPPEPVVLSAPKATQAQVLQMAQEETAANAMSLDDTSLLPSIDVSVPASSRLAYFSDPEGLAAEKFRFLGVRLRELRQSRPLKKVLITSTIPEEGKSLISANLAGVLARRKEKVLLIEGDLRRPVLTEKFGLGRIPGITEWLQNGSQSVSNIYRLEKLGFWFLPAGEAPTHPLELLQSARLAQLMQQLASMFDWIVVDSPPLLPLADTTLWARLTDGVLLVAREGKTEKAQLKQGLEILKKTDLIGVVLNGCTRTDQKNYYQRYAPKK